MTATHDEVRQLARFASFAARVDPELLRRLRVELLPDAAPGLEADLWTSELAEFAHPSGFVFAPGDGQLLRTELLAESRDLYERAYQVTERAHQHLGGVLRAEERLAYLDGLQRGGVDEERAHAEIETRAILRSVLAALAGGGADGLAHWAARALPRFAMEGTLGGDEARQLHVAARVRLDARLDLAEPERGDVAWLLPQAIGEVSVWLERGEDTLRIFDPRGDSLTADRERGVELALPRTDPLAVDIVRGNSSERVFLEESDTVVAVGSGPVRIRTLLGEEFELSDAHALGEQLDRQIIDCGAERGRHQFHGRLPLDLDGLASGMWHVLDGDGSGAALAKAALELEENEAVYSYQVFRMRVPEWRDPDAGVHSICAQLERRLPELASNASDPDVRLQQVLIEFSKTRESGRHSRVWLIVDGLDESDPPLAWRREMPVLPDGVVGICRGIEPDSAPSVGRLKLEQEASVAARGEVVRELESAAGSDLDGGLREQVLGDWLNVTLARVIFEATEKLPNGSSSLVEQLVAIPDLSRTLGLLIAAREPVVLDKEYRPLPARIALNLGERVDIASARLREWLEDFPRHDEAFASHVEEGHRVLLRGVDGEESSHRPHEVAYAARHGLYHALAVDPDVARSLVRDLEFLRRTWQGFGLQELIDQIAELDGLPQGFIAALHEMDSVPCYEAHAFSGSFYQALRSAGVARDEISALFQTELVHLWELEVDGVAGEEPPLRFRVAGVAESPSEKFDAIVFWLEDNTLFARAKSRAAAFAGSDGVSAMLVLGQKLVAVGCENGAVRVLDRVSGQELWSRFSLRARVRKLVLLERGVLIGWSEDGCLHAWDQQTGEERGDCFAGAVTDCVAAGLHLGYVTRRGGVHLWSIDSDPVPASTSTSPARCIGYVDGHLVTGCDDGSIHLWLVRATRAGDQDDAGLAEHLSQSAGHDGGVTRCITNELRQIATLGSDGVARMWAIDRLHLRSSGVLAGGATDDRITAFAWATGKDLAITGSRDGAVQLWRDSGHPQLLDWHDDEVLRVGVVRQGVWSWSRDGTLRERRDPRGRLNRLAGPDHPIPRLLPTGRDGSCYSAEQAVVLYDSGSSGGRALRGAKGSTPVTSVSDDHGYLAVISTARVDILDSSGREVWHARSGPALAGGVLDWEREVLVIWDRSGQMFAPDAGRARTRRFSEPHRAPIRGGLLLRDGLVTVSLDGTVRLTDLDGEVRDSVDLGSPVLGCVGAMPVRAGPARVLVWTATEVVMFEVRRSLGAATKSSIADAEAVVARGEEFFVGTAGGEVYQVAGRPGPLLVVYSDPGKRRVVQIGWTDDLIVVAFVDGAMLAVNDEGHAVDGAKITGTPTDLLLTGDRAYVGNANGDVWVFALHDEPIVEEVRPKKRVKTRDKKREKARAKRPAKKSTRRRRK